MLDTLLLKWLNNGPHYFKAFLSSQFVLSGKEYTFTKNTL